MKELLLKSMKQNTRVTVILALICIGLIGLTIVQNIQYNKMLNEQNEKFTEMMTVQEPDIKDFPNRKLGKFTLSWYSPKELGRPEHQLKTSSGTRPKRGRTIAVDPKVIPYGSIVYIQDYGYYIAEDCGGDIKSNRIDIYTNSHKEAIQQGKKVAQVWILGQI